MDPTLRPVEDYHTHPHKCTRIRALYLFDWEVADTCSQVPNNKREQLLPECRSCSLLSWSETQTPQKTLCTFCDVKKNLGGAWWCLGTARGYHIQPTRVLFPPRRVSPVCLSVCLWRTRWSPRPADRYLSIREDATLLRSVPEKTHQHHADDILVVQPDLCGYPAAGGLAPSLHVLAVWIIVSTTAWYAVAKKWQGPRRFTTIVLRGGVCKPSFCAPPAIDYLYFTGYRVYPWLVGRRNECWS